VTGRLLVSALTTAVLAVGCSSDGGAPAACAKLVEADTVVVADFAFRPDCLQASQGARIALRNTGDAPHTFTVEDTTVDISLPAGSRADASLLGVEPGRYAVTCTFHPEMRATLIVA
jgi:plastocyanin